MASGGSGARSSGPLRLGASGKASGCPGHRAVAFFERRLPQCGRPLPISCCQRLITPRGNSRASMPTRRQASGHIWSNALSRRNNSLCETSPTSELGHCSAAIFSSASSGAISCFSVVMANPLAFRSSAVLKIRQPLGSGCAGHHEKAHCCDGIKLLQHDSESRYRVLRGGLMGMP